MTRKQAILQAIKYLNTIEGIDNEIITCLTDISNELPLTKWTKSRVLDTIDEFFSKYGWLPVASDFKSCKEHLPSITVINYLFGTKSIERLYSQYFIDDKYKKCNGFSPYRGNSKTFFINIFTENYRYIQKKLNCSYVTVKMYNNNRKKNTPTIITIKKALNCSTYKELLNKCNIQYEENIKKSPSIQLSNITIIEKGKNDILEELIKYCYKQ